MKDYLKISFIFVLVIALVVISFKLIPTTKEVISKEKAEVVLLFDDLMEFDAYDGYYLYGNINRSMLLTLEFYILSNNIYLSYSINYNFLRKDYFVSVMPFGDLTFIASPVGNFNFAIISAIQNIGDINLKVWGLSYE